jgi:nitrogen fixation/metabolism regulation signal transduction histidine kinase
MGLTQYLSTKIHSEEEENIIKIILSNEKVISDILLTLDNYLRNINANLSSLNIYELVKSYIDIFKKDEIFKNISINFITKDNNIKILCDEYILKQIINNILLNYSQTIINNNYSKSNSINIHISKIEANVSLIISSNALIFNKYQLKYNFKYHYSSKDSDNLFDLRLATTKKLAKALGARIRFLNNQNDDKKYSSVEIILKTI